MHTTAVWPQLEATVWIMQLGDLPWVELSAITIQGNTIGITIATPPATTTVINALPMPACLRDWPSPQMKKQPQLQLSRSVFLKTILVHPIKEGDGDGQQAIATRHHQKEQNLPRGPPN